MPNARTIPMYAFYTALVAVSTLIFTIYVPATHGYFNMGESAIFTVALLAGGRAGAFAGGIGSMIADIALGYYFFAPATLLIKGIEGGALGVLAGKRLPLSVQAWRTISLAIGAAIALAIFFIGSTYYTGETDVSLGLPWLGYSSFTLAMPAFLWAAVGLAAGGLVIATSFASRPEAGYAALCSIAAGSLMILGYFLFEQFVLGYVAIAEVPFNIVQVLVGMAIAVPAYNSLKALKRSSA